MATFIHPTAIIESGAQVGADCEIMAGAVIKDGTILGDRAVVCEYSVIGGAPQSIAFDRAVKTGVRVGAGTVVREHVTINRATHAGKSTEIGEKCFLMTGCHIAHDCRLANNVVLANAVLLAGHVTVGANAFLGGGACVHQFARIGEGAMVSGNASLTRDIAPFTTVAGRDGVIGLNLVGLKRRGVSREAIRELKTAFHEVYSTYGNIRDIAAHALAGGRYATAEAKHFLGFFAGGKRSFARPIKRHAQGPEDDGAE